MPSGRGTPAGVSERGGALLAVLWLSAALAAIAFSLASTVRSETERAATNSEGLRTSYLATGSIERGIQWMMWGDAYRNQDGSPRFWEPNLPRLRMTFPSGEAIVEMIPEMAKLNVNTASPADLTALLSALTDDPLRASAIATGIVNWRGGGDASSAPIFGVASTFPPRHASIQEIEELLAVPGITPELFYGSFSTDPTGTTYPHAGLRDCLSVWGSSGGPYDINTVSPELIEAAGVPRAQVTEIVKRRSAAPIAPKDVAGLGLPGKFVVGGNFIWTLRATARLRNADGSPSDVVRTAAAVVKLVDRTQYFVNPVHVLRYYEDAWSPYIIAPPGRAPGVPLPGVPIQ